jgi:hypothetical protein
MASSSFSLTRCDRKNENFAGSTAPNATLNKAHQNTGHFVRGNIEEGSYYLQPLSHELHVHSMIDDLSKRTWQHNPFIILDTRSSHFTTARHGDTDVAWLV